MRTRLQVLLCLIALAPASAFAQYSIQLGSFGTPGEAVGRAAEFPGSRIDVSEDVQGKSRYRVLLGEYATVAEAEKAIAEAGYRGKIPDVWVNPERNRPWVPPAGVTPALAKTSEPAVPAATPPTPTSFPIDVTLNCADGDQDGDGEGRGKPGKSYKTRIYLDPSQGQGELDVALRWACEPKPEKRVGRGSHFDLSPTVGFTTVSSAAGSAFRSLYGMTFNAFQRVGGWGPEFTYRILRTGTVEEGSFALPGFTVRHDVKTGARFFFRGGWELAAAFGFSTTDLLISGSEADAKFVNYLLPVLGVAFQKQLVRFEKGSQIWLGAGYEQRFGYREAERTVFAGPRIHGELVLRSALTDSLGGEGFFRFESLSQETSDLDASDSAFLFGFTLSFGPQY